MNGLDYLPPLVWRGVVFDESQKLFQYAGAPYGRRDAEVGMKSAVFVMIGDFLKKSHTTFCA
jgi:hypothetical protein